MLARASTRREEIGSGTPAGRSRAARRLERGSGRRQPARSSRAPRRVPSSPLTSSTDNIIAHGYARTWPAAGRLDYTPIGPGHGAGRKGRCNARHRTRAGERRSRRLR